MPQPLLLGHRGASRYAPENTIAAFDQALTHGCDGFEFDVRLSADLQPVIVHDTRLEDAVIADHAAEKLHAMQDTIPRMWQVFERYAATAYLNVEMKVTGLEKRVVKLLEVYPPVRGFMVSSFLPEAIRGTHAYAPNVPLGYICRDPDRLQHWQELPVTHVVLHHTLATPQLLEKLKAAEKKVFVWTVNKQEDMQAMAALGVDGIISDDTRLLCDVLRNRSDATASTNR